jgi:hypothetical protein
LSFPKIPSGPDSHRKTDRKNLFLRHQLTIALRQAPPRLRFSGSNRVLLLWMTLSSENPIQLGLA